MILKYMGWMEWTGTVVCTPLIILQVYPDLGIPGYMTEITEAIERSAPLSEIYNYGTKMILCAITSFTVSLPADTVATYISASFSKHLRTLSFSKVGVFTPGDIGSFSTEFLITRYTNDVMQVQNLVAKGLTALIRTPIMAI